MRAGSLAFIQRPNSCFYRRRSAVCSNKDVAWNWDYNLEPLHCFSHIHDSMHSGFVPSGSHSCAVSATWTVAHAVARGQLMLVTTLSFNCQTLLPATFSSSIKLNSSLRSRWSNMQVVSISLPGGRTKTAVHRCSMRKQLTLLVSVCSDNSLKPDVLQLSHTAAQSEPRRFILLFFIFHFHLIQLWKLSLKFS